MIIPDAYPEQVKAAEMVYYGKYECEFNQTVDIAQSPKHSAYVTVKHGKGEWLMKPVLSSTGAIRLEDVKRRDADGADRQQVDAAQHHDRAPHRRRVHQPEAARADRGRQGGQGGVRSVLSTVPARRPSSAAGVCSAACGSIMAAMPRPFNFSPGPAALPEPVLRQAASEMLDWNGTGVSVMEVSHRGKEFMALQAGIEADLRELLAIPGELQGAVPAGRRDRPERDRADEPAARQDAAPTTSTPAPGRPARSPRRAHYCEVNVAASGEASGFTSIPKQAEWRLDPDAAYVHICANETIGGVEYHWVPETGAVPLVADMSSNILSRPIDVSRYGLIYGGAQKNIGPAGLTFVIVREDLLGGALPITPEAFNYTIQAAARLDDQHAAHLRHLPGGAGVPLDQGRRRPGGDGRAQPRQGGACCTKRSTPAASTSTGSPGTTAR